MSCPKQHMRNKLRILPYILWTLLTIIIPLLLILYYSFLDVDQNFTLINFQDALSPRYLHVLGRSLQMAFITTTICLLIGFPTALFISRIPAQRQKIVLFLFILPTWTNIILRIYAWMAMFYKDGVIENFFSIFGLNISLQYSTFAVYLGMVYNFLPFMILPLYTAINKIDGSLIEAATDLGATKWQRLKSIIFPLSMPGIITGIIMVFLPAATTFVIPQLLSGGKYNLIGNVIERQFTTANNMYFGAALSIILIIIIVLSIYVMEKTNNKYRRKGHKK